MRSSLCRRRGRSFGSGRGRFSWRTSRGWWSARGQEARGSGLWLFSGRAGSRLIGGPSARVGVVRARRGRACGCSARVRSVCRVAAPFSRRSIRGPFLVHACVVGGGCRLRRRCQVWAASFFCTDVRGRVCFRRRVSCRRFSHVVGMFLGHTSRVRAMRRRSRWRRAHRCQCWRRCLVSLLGFRGFFRVGRRRAAGRGRAERAACRAIGNAVPPPMMRALASAVLDAGVFVGFGGGEPVVAPPVSSRASLSGLPRCRPHRSLRSGRVRVDRCRRGRCRRSGWRARSTRS